MIRSLGAFAAKSPSRLQRITYGDPVLGNPSTNPSRLRRYGLFYFILSLLQAGLGHKTKNPQALPEGLVEVGGGFEPP